MEERGRAVRDCSAALFPLDLSNFLSCFCLADISCSKSGFVNLLSGVYCMYIICSYYAHVVWFFRILCYKYATDDNFFPADYPDLSGPEKFTF